MYWPIHEYWICEKVLQCLRVIWSHYLEVERCLWCQDSTQNQSGQRLFHQSPPLSPHLDTKHIRTAIRGNMVTWTERKENVISDREYNTPPLPSFTLTFRSAGFVCKGGWSGQERRRLEHSALKFSKNATGAFSTHWPIREFCMMT